MTAELTARKKGTIMTKCLDFPIVGLKKGQTCGKIIKCLGGDMLS
jgi:hypothetical protein